MKKINIIALSLLTLLPLSACNSNQDEVSTSSETTLTTDWDDNDKYLMELYLGGEILPFYQDIFGYEEVEDEDDDETLEETYAVYLNGDTWIITVSLEDEYIEDAKTYKDYVLNNNFGYVYNELLSDEDNNDFYLSKTLVDTSVMYSEVILNVVYLEGILYLNAHLEETFFDTSFPGEDLVSLLNYDVADFYSYSSYSPVTDVFSDENFATLDSSNISEVTYSNILLDGEYIIEVAVETSSSALDLEDLEYDLLNKGYLRDIQHDTSSSYNYYLVDNYDIKLGASIKEATFALDVDIAPLDDEFILIYTLNL